MQRAFAVLFLLVAVAVGCGRRHAAPEAAPENTFAELRTIKGAITVSPPGHEARRAYPRERIVEGESITVPQGGLAWIRRDGGATWLVAGPAELVLRSAVLELREGRAFVDSELGAPAELQTPRGKLELSDARASIDALPNGATSVYVLRGSARASGAGRATAGEQLTLTPDGKSTRAPVVSWEDWTGGLATADPAADPAPFGIGTVGARKPGDTGKPRFSLVVQRLDVRVRIDHDFAVTEVDQTFVNPSSDTVEGMFSFRTPPRAVLHRFGVDRKGELVWGRVQESAAAVRQYESNVYAGSEEDPALLQWAGLGVYGARLYPIHAGTTRRVVTRYAEWLTRHGPRGERRLYVYPMAAEGARGSLPRIEELSVTFDLAQAAAVSVRSGMGGKRDGNKLVVKAFDFVPRADLALELFDNGQSAPVAYRAQHRLPSDEAPKEENAEFARRVSSEEPDYIAVPLRAIESNEAAPAGLDLAIVIDTSAATEPGALAIARSMASSLLAHLGPEDRAALWAGDATLRAVAADSGELSKLDAAKRKAWIGGLAAVERGGATDIGALLTQAASKLDPKRRGAIVYVGDGQPSVGELAPKALRERLARLPASTRILAAGVGSEPNIALLETLARGAAVERVSDAYGAARAALRLLEAAGRPAWLGAQVDFGPTVERVLPRELPVIGHDENSVVIGRIKGKVPTSVTLRSSAGTVTQSFAVRHIDDGGDLRRRWGEARLGELIGEGAGRSALVEIGKRFGLVSPFTSLYVPTEREQATVVEEHEDPAAERDALAKRWIPWRRDASQEEAPIPVMSAIAEFESAEVSTKAAEPSAEKAGRRYGVQGPSDNPLAAAPLTTGTPLSLEPDPESPPSAIMPSVPSEAAAGKARAAQTVARPRTLSPTIPSPPALPDVEPAPKPMPMRRSAGGSSVGPQGAGAFGLLGAMSAAAKGESKSAPAPSAAAAKTEPPPAPVSAHPLGFVGHQRKPCGAAADLPLEQRQVLWRERLASASSVALTVNVYREALRACEASRWDERVALLVFMVDHLSSVRDRVALWRALLGISPAAADAVYRFLLLRVQTADDLKQLHDALGFKRIESHALDALLAKAKTAAERLMLLRGAAVRFADDTELALLVLDAYEDAGDDAGGRAWARRLRRRVDATAHVRTNVGEYYLRLGKALGDAGKRDIEEARRTFGELVEFAPEDPLARRRLGDLLRAHGWYEEAFRQYETLAQLTPDDASVPLLLAGAAQGMGKVEEAVRWAEKAAAVGSPDDASPVALAARATASAFLAWARDDARRAGRHDEAERLTARARRASGDTPSEGSVRLLLTWSHPELRPSLWTNELGSPMPAHDNLPLYGVAQARLAAEPSPRVEVRLDEDDAARAARLDARATLTAISSEGQAGEIISRIDVSFRGSDGKALATVPVRFESGALTQEQP